MTAAEAISRYEPIEESEKFKIEYWQLKEEKLLRMPRPGAGIQGCIRDRRRLGHRRGDRPPPEP